MQGEIEDGSFEQAAELQKAGRFVQAAELYQRLADKVLTVNLAINLGLCLTETGDFPRAQHYLGLAAGARPDNMDIRRLQGFAYAEAGQIDLAEAAYPRRPGDRARRRGRRRWRWAGLYLSLGRYAEGWPLLGARVALHPGVVPVISISFPEWLGEPLDGKSILVWVEQGFGDQIQMARFTREMKARGAARMTPRLPPAADARLLDPWPASTP